MMSTVEQQIGSTYWDLWVNVAKSGIDHDEAKVLLLDSLHSSGSQSTIVEAERRLTDTNVAMNAARLAARSYEIQE
jgi:fatty acid-binding protein DegV